MDPASWTGSLSCFVSSFPGKIDLTAIIIPVLVLYLALQRVFIERIANTGAKGQPRGTAEPGNEDRMVTETPVTAGNLARVSVVDHNALQPHQYVTRPPTPLRWQTRVFDSGRLVVIFLLTYDICHKTIFLPRRLERDEEAFRSHHGDGNSFRRPR